MTLKDRPAADYERGRTTAILRVLGPAIAMVGIVLILVGYVGLPATIPTHFGIAGEADSFGPRWSVLVLAGIWIVMQAGVALLAAHPRAFNYPLPVTSANAQRLYREGERMIVWLGVAVAATFAGISLSVFDAPGGPLTVLGLAATFAAMIVGVTRLLRAG
jgi:uncharacterized membrane protein